jgi:hypothetical protein
MRRKTLHRAEIALEITVRRLAEADAQLDPAAPSEGAFRRVHELLRQVTELEKMVERGRAEQTRAEAARAKSSLIADKTRLDCEACAFSYAMPDATRVMQCHHVIPVADGGSNDATNLVILCANCHAIAHILRDNGAMVRDRGELLQTLKRRPA